MREDRCIEFQCFKIKVAGSARVWVFTGNCKWDFFLNYPWLWIHADSYHGFTTPTRTRDQKGQILIITSGITNRTIAQVPSPNNSYLVSCHGFQALNTVPRLTCDIVSKFPTTHTCTRARPEWTSARIWHR